MNFVNYFLKFYLSHHWFTVAIFVVEDIGQCGCMFTNWFEMLIPLILLLHRIKHAESHYKSS